MASADVSFADLAAVLLKREDHHFAGVGIVFRAEDTAFNKAHRISFRDYLFELQFSWSRTGRERGKCMQAYKEVQGKEILCAVAHIMQKKSAQPTVFIRIVRLPALM